MELLYAAYALPRFVFGTVLYDNTDVVPSGDRLVAPPLSCLWN